jgi:hypothetical protein
MHGSKNRHLVAYAGELEEALKAANADKAQVREWAEGLRSGGGQ